MQSISGDYRKMWENRNEIGWFKAFWKTLRTSLLEPGRFYESIPVCAGYEGPLYYALICMSLGLIAGTLYQLMFQALFGFIGLAFNHSMPEFALTTGFYFLIAAGSVIVAPFASLIHLFFQAGVYHAFLWMLGGDRKGFEASFRVVAYSQGPQIFLLVPIFGGLAAIVWQYVLLIIGFRKVQEARLGQSLATVFLPIVLLCGLTLFFAMSLIALILMAIGLSSK